jgi:hypothetical protein
LASWGNTGFRFLAALGGPIHVHHAVEVLEPRAVDHDGVPSSFKSGVLDPIFKVKDLHALLKWVHTVLHERRISVVFCHMGKTVLVEVEVLAVALINLQLEGCEDVIAHGVDLVLPKEVGMEGAVHLPSVLGRCEFLHVLSHAGGQEKRVENRPNLLQVSEKGWDKRALEFELVVLEVIIAFFGQDEAASDRLVVMRCVLRLSCDCLIVSESGVSLGFFGD